jgi:hypothetical protein
MYIQRKIWFFTGLAALLVSLINLLNLNIPVLSSIYVIAGMLGLMTLLLLVGLVFWSNSATEQWRFGLLILAILIGGIVTVEMAIRLYQHSPLVKSSCATYLCIIAISLIGISIERRPEIAKPSE